MKSSIVLQVILFIAAAMLIGVGIFSLTNPIAFVARNGVDVAGNLSLLNDIRGNGGLMLGGGLVILLGVIFSRIRYASTVTAALLYLFFGLGRVVSILVDGMPSDTLVKATVVELVVGVVVLIAYFRFRDPAQFRQPTTAPANA
ncbi:DUF4345 domain-containing protein [Pontibacter sp. G13]|uniref:DUF4345 domain-containing protein n=1 Tax=Pontibacter sp. G13 TaxID=3074898 RepID=UPI002888FF61|nr:DUF4345 domain-containing protein [Pontibacter sp. G13]WNJ20304.1 DUF4345 domain-containing protein [Pontibacter sp. G13]